VFKKVRLILRKHWSFLHSVNLFVFVQVSGVMEVDDDSLENEISAVDKTTLEHRTATLAAMYVLARFNHHFPTVLAGHQWNAPSFSMHAINVC